nr:MAG TPA: hypothetical protein [Caudoviricetes sp.]DAR40747.1 MAG TPA: hypothetical protein [Caudoviricetes sp.]DAY76977.1 MAG TPA: hypothetical protein [Caudoviricetes sp.]
MKPLRCEAKRLFRYGTREVRHFPTVRTRMKIISMLQVTLF